MSDCLACDQEIDFETPFGAPIAEHKAAELQALSDAAVAKWSAVERDAERYRWLQEHTIATGLSRWIGKRQFLSAAVDAAINGGAA